MGLAKSLIYQKKISNKTIDTIFLATITVGGFITFIVIAFAKYIALIFSQSDVKNILQISAITIFITSLSIVPSTLLEKNLAFNKKAIPEISSLVTYSIVSISLAMAEFGIWSIVLGKIIQVIISNILVWRIATQHLKFRLSFGFDITIAKKCWDYGQPVVINSILTILFLHIDNIYIAKYLGPTALGHYAFAFMVVNLPTMIVTHTLTKVMFPAYVLLTKNSEQLVTAYLASIRYTSFITLPIIISLIVLGDNIIDLFYANKWHDSIKLIPILSIYAFFRSIGALPSNVLHAINKHYLIPRFMLVYIIILNLLLSSIVIVWGIIGVAVVMTGVMVVGSTVWIIITNYFLRVGPIKTVRIMLPQITGGTTMFIILLFFDGYIDNSLLETIAVLTLSTFIYLASTLWLMKHNLQ